MTVWIIKMEWCLPREIRIMTNGRMQIVQNNTLVRALHGGLWLSLCMQLQLWFTQSLPLGSLGKITLANNTCDDTSTFLINDGFWWMWNVTKNIWKKTPKNKTGMVSLSLFLNKLQLLLKLIIKYITFTLHGYNYRY